jgi:hypothetical protein
MSFSDTFDNSALWKNFQGDISFGSSSFNFNYTGPTSPPQNCSLTHQRYFVNKSIYNTFGIYLYFSVNAPSGGLGVQNLKFTLTTQSGVDFFVNLTLTRSLNRAVFTVDGSAAPPVVSNNLVTPSGGIYSGYLLLQFTGTDTQTQSNVGAILNINGTTLGSVTTTMMPGLDTRKEVILISVLYTDTGTTLNPFLFLIDLISPDLTGYENVGFFSCPLVFPTFDFTGRYVYFQPGGVGPNKFFFYCTSLTNLDTNALNTINPDSIEGGILFANEGSAALVNDPTKRTFKESLYVLKKSVNPVQNLPSIVVPLTGGGWYWERAANTLVNDCFLIQVTETNLEYNVTRVVDLTYLVSPNLVYCIITLVSAGKIVTNNYNISFANKLVSITKTLPGTDPVVLINVYKGAE